MTRSPGHSFAAVALASSPVRQKRVAATWAITLSLPTATAASPRICSTALISAQHHSRELALKREVERISRCICTSTCVGLHRRAPGSMPPRSRSAFSIEKVLLKRPQARKNGGGHDREKNRKGCRGAPGHANLFCHPQPKKIWRLKEICAYLGSGVNLPAISTHL